MKIPFDHRQDVTNEEAARDARLPGNVFRAMRNAHRPSVDRADELCLALGITITLSGKQNDR